MKVRARSRWRDRERRRSLDDNAVALAYVIWEIALTAAKTLHTEGFAYENDTRRIEVICEYLVFLVHVTDRLCHERMSDAERTRFVTRLAADTARHVQRNREDLSGAGEYREAYVELLNRRAKDYAETSFRGGGPGYAMLRTLAAHIQTVLGTGQTNRWAADHVMEIDAPEAVRHLGRAFDNLLDTSAPSSPPGAE